MQRRECSRGILLPFLNNASLSLSLRLSLSLSLPPSLALCLHLVFSLSTPSLSISHPLSFSSSTPPPPQTFHTPSLGDEEFEIPSIPLDSDSALSSSSHHGVSHFGDPSPDHDDGVVIPGNAVVDGDDPSFASTYVNTPSRGLEHLSLGVISQPGGGALLGSSLGMVRTGRVPATDPSISQTLLIITIVYDTVKCLTRRGTAQEKQYEEKCLSVKCQQFEFENINEKSENYRDAYEKPQNKTMTPVVTCTLTLDKYLLL